MKQINKDTLQPETTPNTKLREKNEILSEPKKILIVSRAFYPSNSPRSFRTTELVKEFARQGHDVTLLTPKDNEVHEEFEKKHGVKIKDLGDLKFEPIDASKGNGIARLVRKVMRRGLYQLFEYPNIEFLWKVKNSLSKESGYDLLITIAVPHPIHWGTAWAKRNGNKIADTWAADCGDPFMGSDMDTFSKMFYFKYFEKSFCRRADYITVPFEGAKEGYYPEFRDKIKVIPQGFKWDKDKINHKSYKPNKVPTFAYAGGLIPGTRDPRPFLDYLMSLDKEFKFILYTRDMVMVEPYLKKAGDKIEIRDYIPREELLSKLSRMEFVVNFENSSSLMMPSKLIDYYITGRPVLSIDPQNFNEDTIDEFLDGNYAAQYEFEDMDRYQIENVCRNFVNLCRN